MRVVINGHTMNFQEGDEIEIQNIECGRCETTHQEITVTRAGKVIAHFGEYVRLTLGKKQIFSDVVEDHQ